MSSTTHVRCRWCGLNRIALAQDEPCPHCGSTDRAMEAFVADVAGAEDLVVEITMTYPNHRAWWQQWQTVHEYLRDLQAIYQDGEREQRERLVDELLKACWALKDWLYNDDHITPRISKQELNSYVNGSKALTVCQAYANTSKHGKRTSPAELHARIKGFRIRSGVMQVMISYWSSTQPARSIDALQLAERCVKDWQQFLRDKQLSPPG